MIDKIEKRKQPLPCRTMARQQRLCGRRGGAAYRVCTIRRGIYGRTKQLYKSSSNESNDYTISLLLFTIFLFK